MCFFKVTEALTKSFKQNDYRADTRPGRGFTLNPPLIAGVMRISLLFIGKKCKNIIFKNYCVYTFFCFLHFAECNLEWTDKKITLTQLPL